MKFNKFIIFDISGEFAHFRKFNTTTSPLTYPVPPRTTLAGMLGAIIGIDRFSFYEIFSREKAFIAVQIIKPIRKTSHAFNLVDTKRSFFNIANRTQIEFELIQNAHYRIFVSVLDKKIYSLLNKNISLNQTYFTPYLGLSQFTAKTEFITESEGKNKEANSYTDIITALNLSHCKKENPIEFDYTSKYSSNTMAIEMQLEENNKRIVTEFGDVLVELEGKPIKARVNNYIHIENFGNIKEL